MFLPAAHHAKPLEQRDSRPPTKGAQPPFCGRFPARRRRREPHAGLLHSTAAHGTVVPWGHHLPLPLLSPSLPKEKRSPFKPRVSVLLACKLNFSFPLSAEKQQINPREAGSPGSQVGGRVLGQEQSSTVWRKATGSRGSSWPPRTEDPLQQRSAPPAALGSPARSPLSLFGTQKRRGEASSPPLGGTAHPAAAAGSKEKEQG